MKFDSLRCPQCGATHMTESPQELRCSSCGATLAIENGVLQLAAGTPSAPPLPLAHGDLDSLFRDSENGATFRASLEALLLELDPEKADRLMLLLSEGRGAWHPLTRVRRGSALWMGNAFSGGWLPLAQSGFDVLVFDSSPDRARFAALRAQSQPSSHASFLTGTSPAELPFENEAFELVVQEEGLPGPADVEFAHSEQECLRVTRGECFFTVENRLAYKRSTGRRARFELARPLRWLSGALAPGPGQATRRGHERKLGAPDFEKPRSHALYPHVRDFTHVVDLDGGKPQLPIGPLERKNRLKILGASIGLFPVLTPSFVCGVARRGAVTQRSSRVEALLERLAQELGEPVPVVENWTATRGNCAVLLTQHERGESPGWAIHIPMNEKERRELERHDAYLRLLRARFPEFPVPEPLFCGELDGLWLTCERRLGGIAATQVSRELACATRLLDDTARHLAGLIMEETRPLDDDDFAKLLTPRFDRVGSKAHLPATIAHVEAAREKALSTLRGLPVPRVFYHADIRSKHVRVRRDGTVLGYLDFGCSSVNDLPYFDLVNLVVHENKRPGEFPSTNAWNRLLDRKELSKRETDALDSYASALSLPEEYCRTIEEIYPVLVVAMCELNWDCSRPRWLHEHFGY